MGGKDLYEVLENFEEREEVSLNNEGVSSDTVGPVWTQVPTCLQHCGCTGKVSEKCERG